MSWLCRSSNFCLLLLCFLSIILGGSGLKRIGGGDGGGAADELDNFQVVDDAFHSIAGGILPASENEVIHSGDGQKLSRAFRAVASDRSNHDAGSYYHAVSPSGLSTIGFVHYTFESSRTKYKGESFQSLLSCRCVSPACNYSIAAIPVIVSRPGMSNRRSCIYMRQKKQRKLVRCLAPLLNISRVSRSVDVKQLSPILRLAEVWNYAVGNDLGVWNARGIRNTSLEISENDFEKLPFADIEDINISAKPVRSDIEDINYSNIELVAENGPRYNSTNDPCVETMGFALAAGAWKGGELDRNSIASANEGFVEEPPDLLRDIELSFVIAATLIGLAAAAKLLYARSHQEQTGGESLYALFIAFCIYLLESLILYTTYALTYASYKWRGVFSHVDAVLAAFRGSKGDQFDATGSVFVLVVSLGTARFRVTKIALVTALMVLATLVFLVSVLLYAKSEWRRWVQFVSALWNSIVICFRVRRAAHDDSDEDVPGVHPSRLGTLSFWLLSSKNMSQGVITNSLEQPTLRQVRSV